MSLKHPRKRRTDRNALLRDVPGAVMPKDLVPFKILKERLDHDFSELARMSRADDEGIVTCIDGCGKSGHWKEFDCGHFADRDNLPTRWDLFNGWPQAQDCNRFKKGRLYQYGQALNKMEPGLADRLLLKSKEPADQVRHDAAALLVEIREALKVQRKRFPK